MSIYTFETRPPQTGVDNVCYHFAVIDINIFTINYWFDNLSIIIQYPMNRAPLRGSK